MSFRNATAKQFMADFCSQIPAEHKQQLRPSLLITPHSPNHPPYCHCSPPLSLVCVVVVPSLLPSAVSRARMTLLSLWSPISHSSHNRRRRRRWRRRRRCHHHHHQATSIVHVPNVVVAVVGEAAAAAARAPIARPTTTTSRGLSKKSLFGSSCSERVYSERAELGNQMMQ